MVGSLRDYMYFAYFVKFRAIFPEYHLLSLIVPDTLSGTCQFLVIAEKRYLLDSVRLIFQRNFNLSLSVLTQHVRHWWFLSPGCPGNIPDLTG